MLMPMKNPLKFATVHILKNRVSIAGQTNLSRFFNLPGQRYQTPSDLAAKLESAHRINTIEIAQLMM